MRKTTTLRADDIVKTFEALPKREQSKVFLRLVQSPKIQDELDDLVDAAIAEAGRREPTEPMEDVFAEMHRRRRRNGK